MIGRESQCLNISTVKLEEILKIVISVCNCESATERWANKREVMKRLEE